MRLLSGQAPGPGRHGHAGGRRGLPDPFKFTGKLAMLTVKVDWPKLTPADEKPLREQGQRDDLASE
jgi:hypothetical protein